LGGGGGEALLWGGKGGLGGGGGPSMLANASQVAPGVGPKAKAERHCALARSLRDSSEEKTQSAAEMPHAAA
jgi:hypothetical protein